MSQLLTDVFSLQLFVKGYVHCDPHPGNVFVVRNPNKWFNSTEIVILDHGLYHTIDDEFRVKYCELWKAIVNRNDAEMKRVAKSLGVESHELFAVMLTSRNWDVNDVGMHANMSEEERENLRQYGQDNFFNMTQVLSGVNRQLLLLLKAKYVFYMVAHFL